MNQSIQNDIFYCMNNLVFILHNSTVKFVLNLIQKIEFHILFLDLLTCKTPGIIWTLDSEELIRIFKIDGCMNNFIFEYIYIYIYYIHTYIHTHTLPFFSKYSHDDMTKTLKY